jgi:hypothetical protein
MDKSLYDNVLTLFGHFALIVGIFCVGKSLYNFVRHTQSRMDYPLENCVWLFFVGIIFVSISQSWSVLTATFGLDKSAVLSAPGAETQLQQLSMLLTVIGFGFFLKGVLMLKREAEVPQYGVGPAIVTLMAAVLIGNAGGIQKLFM